MGGAPPRHVHDFIFKAVPASSRSAKKCKYVVVQWDVCLSVGERSTRVLISIKAMCPNYTSSSSLICNLNLSHSHHKQGVTFSV